MNNIPDPVIGDSVGQLRDYEPGMEAGIVEVLQECFRGRWGSVDSWLWKHARRPGFDPRQIRVLLKNGRPAACFHSGVFSIKLADGLDVPCSLEGDYAVLPEFRGGGLLERAFDEMGERLAADGVVLRIGFTSPELQKRVYHKKFGHTFVPTVTALYRRIISTTLLCEKIEHFAKSLQARPLLQRILRRGALHIELRVTGFDVCYLTLDASAVVCTATNTGARQDLRVRVPYRILICGRNGAAAAFRTCLGALLCGEVRVSGLWRFSRRLLAL